MPALYQILNKIDKTIAHAIKQFSEALPQQLSPSAHDHSEMTQKLRHALGYDITEKTIHSLSIKEIEHAQIVMALHSCQVKAFFTQQMGLILNEIHDIPGDANNIQSNIERGAVITGLVKIMDAELKALNDLHNALEAERKEKYPPAPAETALLIHSIPYTAYQENSIANGLFDLMGGLFGGGPSDGGFLSCYQWNQGFNAGYGGADPSWSNIFSNDYNNGYGQGQLDHALFHNVFPYIGHELKEGFTALFRLSENAARGFGRAASNADSISSTLDSSLHGLSHSVSTDCCHMTHAAGHCCEGFGHEAGHAAQGCGKCLGQGCGDCLKAVGSLAESVCHVLGAIVRTFGDCCGALGQIDADCCKAVGSLFSLVATGVGSLLGVKPQNDDSSDTDDIHSISNTTSATNAQPPHDFLHGYGEAAWWTVIAVLGLMFLRNSAHTIHHIHKNGLAHDKKRLALMWGTALVTGSIGLLIHIPDGNKVIGGPKTAWGTALSMSLIAYYLYAMTSKHHGIKAYGSADPQQNFLASSTLMAMEPKQKIQAAEVMNALQIALDLVKKQDLANRCSKPYWSSIFLGDYSNDDSPYEILGNAQTQMRKGEFSTARATLGALSANNIQQRYGNDCAAQITKIQAVLRDFYYLPPDSEFSTACCC